MQQAEADRQKFLANQSEGAASHQRPKGARSFVHSGEHCPLTPNILLMASPSNPSHAQCFQISTQLQVLKSCLKTSFYSYALVS